MWQDPRVDYPRCRLISTAFMGIIGRCTELHPPGCGRMAEVHPAAFSGSHQADKGGFQFRNMYEPATSWYWWMMQRARQDPAVPAAQRELAVAPPATVDDAAPLLLTVKEAAALMRVGRDTTYSLVDQRRIPCIKLGKQIRIPRKALISHLEKEALQQTLDLDQERGE